MGIAISRLDYGSFERKKSIRNIKNTKNKTITKTLNLINVSELHSILSYYIHHLMKLYYR